MNYNMKNYKKKVQILNNKYVMKGSSGIMKCISVVQFFLEKANFDKNGLPTRLENEKIWTSRI